MLQSTGAYSEMSTNDIEAAREFYGSTLGLTVAVIFIYSKPDHTPAAYTALHSPVADIDAAVDELTAAGVVFQRYEGAFQDDKGIARG